ncbi:MAG: M14 family zinc carboxypeptidase [Fimbriimonadaceae bacterium]
MLMAALGVSLVNADFDWELTCEKTNWLRTGRYEEAYRFCEQLSLLPNVQMFPIGDSPEGRPMVVMILSTDSEVLNPVKRKKPLLFINNGIHSGEIEGKDADLILARRMMQPDGAPDSDPNWSGLLDKASLAFIPVFSVDAHDRMSRYNRANQNGPEEMGWRVTGENFNLNRDWVKADALEMQNLLNFANSLEPDFYIDNHTTDGGDWQYVAQYDVPMLPTMPSATVDISKKFVSEVMPLADKAGFLTAPYFGNFDERRPERGITLSPFGPRYSTGYWSSRNRPSMLVETHVLKPYKDRLFATLELNRLTLDWMGKNGSLLRTRNNYADIDSMGLKEGDDLVLSARNSGKSRPFIFKGLRFEPYKSDVSGSEIPHWTREKVDYPTVIRDQFEANLVVKAPAGWLVPSNLRDVTSRLKLHRIEMIPVSADVVGTKIKLPVQKFVDYKFGTETFEGRMMPRFKLVSAEREVAIPAGSMVVPIGQRLGRLAAQLLEAEAGDSFAAWGFFNGFMEQKEYAEAYAMEPFAKKMLEDPTIKAAFEEAMKDPTFAGNPGARLNWFFERSPYYDSRLGINPVIRLTGADMAKIVK